MMVSTWSGKSSVIFYQSQKRWKDSYFYFWFYKNDSEKNFLDKWYIFLDWGQKIEIDQNWESSIENKASWTLLITWEILSANQRRAFHYSPTHSMRKKLIMENSKILSEKMSSMEKKRNRKDIFCQLLWSAKSLIRVLLTAGLIFNPYILD